MLGGRKLKDQERRELGIDIKSKKTNCVAGVSSEGAAARRYMSGMLILSASTLISKVIGLVFKIPMMSLVGIEGMAYFSSAYHIYILLLTLSTAGLPVALSMMTAAAEAEGDGRRVDRIFGVSLAMLLPIGAAGGAVLYFGADTFAALIEIPESAVALRAISPTLFFICASSAMRGYFQGHEIMLPTAVSQLIESLSKLVLGMGLATIAIRGGADARGTAAAAIFGLTIGVAGGAAYLTVKKLIYRRDNAKNRYINAQAHADRVSRRRIAADMLRLAFPITVSASVTSIAGLCDTALITARLTDGGMAHSAAVAVYSGYANLALPLYNLPTALITPVAMSLVPAVSAAVAANDERSAARVLGSAFRVTMFAAIPAALGLAVFADPILSLIYPGQADAIATAAPLLAVLAPAVVSSCLITVTNAVLQAWGHPSLPIISIIAGTVVKAASEYIFVGSSIGAFGAPISTLLCGVTVTALNLIFMRKYARGRAGETLSPSRILRVIAASTIAVAAAVAVYAVILRVIGGRALPLLAAIAVAVLLYIPLAVAWRAVDEADVAALPGGDRISRILRRIMPRTDAQK